MVGALCSLLVGFTFTACEHDDDYVTVADSPLIGTWDIAEGFDAAMNQAIPAYEYLFQTKSKAEEDWTDDNPDSFEGVDRPVQYDRVQFTSDLNGGQAIFYKRDSSGNMVESIRYIAVYSENTIKLFHLNDPDYVNGFIKYEYGDSTFVKEEVTHYQTSLFKEFAVENLDENNLKIVWNKAQRIVVTYTNQYESYNFKRVK